MNSIPDEIRGTFKAIHIVLYYIDEKIDNITMGTAVTATNPEGITKGYIITKSVFACSHTIKVLNYRGEYQEAKVVFALFDYGLMLLECDDPGNTLAVNSEPRKIFDEITYMSYMIDFTDEYFNYTPNIYNSSVSGLGLALVGHFMYEKLVIHGVGIMFGELGSPVVGSGMIQGILLTVENSLGIFVKGDWIAAFLRRFQNACYHNPVPFLIDSKNVVTESYEKSFNTGDKIIKIGGEEMIGTHPMVLMAKYCIGDNISFEIQRGGDTQFISCELTHRFKFYRTIGDPVEAYMYGKNVVIYPMCDYLEQSDFLMHIQENLIWIYLDDKKGLIEYYLQEDGKFYKLSKGKWVLSSLPISKSTKLSLSDAWQLVAAKS